MKRFTSIVTVMFFSAAALFAQQAGERHDFRRTVEMMPFLQSSNPAALSGISFGEISFAGVSATKDNGGLIPLESSDDAIRAEVSTESYGRLSDRMAYHGELSYSYSSGGNMGGPVLMDPLYNPINFYESSEDNTGRRSRELYGASGALSYALGRRLSAGMAFEYESGDQVKVKDPRFRSKWMDMTVSPGLWLQTDGGWGYGVSMHYRRTLEQVLGGIYGTTDRQYFIYTDKGNFFGTSEELSGDYNYLPSSTQRPMSNAFYGLSLQARCEGRGSFYNELKVLYRDGYYGNKSSSTATFFDFGGIDASYEAALVLPSGAVTHRMEMTADFELLSNTENLFRYVTPSGQSTVVEYYGEEKISERILADATLKYDMSSGTTFSIPSLAAGASVTGGYLSNAMTYYPLYRDHMHATVSCEAHGKKSLIRNGGAVTLGCQAAFMTGFGTECEDGSYATSTTSLRSFDNYMHRQFEYDTATRSGAALSLRYTRFVSARASAYIELSDSFTCLLKNPQYLYGRTRNAAVLTVGCSF